MPAAKSRKGRLEYRAKQDHIAPAKIFFRTGGSRNSRLWSTPGVLTGDLALTPALRTGTPICLRSRKKGRAVRLAIDTVSRSHLCSRRLIKILYYLE